MEKYPHIIELSSCDDGWPDGERAVVPMCQRERER